MVLFDDRGWKTVQSLGAATLRLLPGHYSKRPAYRWDVHATTGEESEYANASNGKSAVRQTANGVMGASVVAGKGRTEVAEK
jgi:hypothetical protein